MKIKSLFLSIFIAISCQGYSQILTPKFGDSVYLTSEIGRLNGRIAVPDNSNNFPIVILISGSGPTDMDGNNSQMKNNSLKQLAQELKKEGIASLRFDKRGIASSQVNQNEIDMRFEDYVSDLNRWVDYIHKKNKFSKIIIAGHSEGALIGMIASVDNPKIDAVISLAGSGNNLADVIEDQMKGQPMNIVAEVNRINKALKENKLVDNVPSYLNSLFRASVQPYLISLYKYNPTEVIAKIKIPILIIQGTTDIQINVENAKQLKKAAPKAKLIIIENMNHVFKHCESLDKTKQYKTTYANPNSKIEIQLVSEMTRFIKTLE